MKTLEISLPSTISAYKVPLESFSIHVRFDSSHTASNRLIVVRNTDIQGCVKVIGDGHFVSSDLSTDLGTELQYTGSNQNLYVSNGESDIIFTRKKTITTLAFGSGNIYGTKYLSGGDLQYMPALGYLTSLNMISYDGVKNFSLDSIDTSALTTLTNVANNVTRVRCIEGTLEKIKNIDNLAICRISGQLLEGDVDTLKDNTVMTALDVSYNYLCGDVANIGAMTALTEFGVQGNLDVFGNIEDWLDKVKDAGKQSGTMIMRLYDSQIRLNGAYVLNGTVHRATFSPSGWSLEEV